MENINTRIEELLDEASLKVPVQKFQKTFVEEIQFRQKKLMYLTQEIEKKYNENRRTG